MPGGSGRGAGVALGCLSLAVAFLHLSHIHPPERAWPVKTGVYGLRKHFTREIKASITQWPLPADSSPTGASVKPQAPVRQEKLSLVYTWLPPHHPGLADSVFIHFSRGLAVLPLTLWALASLREEGHPIGEDSFYSLSPQAYCPLP